jgi:hypothetical protein
MQAPGSFVDPAHGAVNPAPVAPCSACKGPAHEVFYAPTGDVVCRLCFWAGQTQAQDARALQSLAEQAPPHFKVVGVGAETPQTSTRNGYIALATCFGSALFTVIVADQLYLWSALIGLFALGSFARAWKLQRSAGKGVVKVVVGIVLSLVVLFLLLLAVLL